MSVILSRTDESIDERPVCNPGWTHPVAVYHGSGKPEVWTRQCYSMILQTEITSDHDMAN